MPKEHIGDGAYARKDDEGSLVITAENGMSITDGVYIDMDHIGNLLQFIKTHFPETWLRSI